jgi:hypothetical protein
MREIIKQWVAVAKEETSEAQDFQIEFEQALTCDKCSCLRITNEEARALDVAWGRTEHPCYTMICECERDRKPPNCQRCNSERILEVSDRSRGSSERVLHHLRIARCDSYALHIDIDGLNDGDGVTGLKLCLECGQVQGQFPVTDPDISEKQMDSDVLIQAVREYETNYF